MGRLIDVDYYCKVNGCSPPYGDVVECVNCCICDCPTIEAEPVRHGWWKSEDERSSMFGRIVSCSECGAMLEPRKIHCYHFCYNCGAKMDSKEVAENVP